MFIIQKCLNVFFTYKDLITYRPHSLLSICSRASESLVILCTEIRLKSGEANKIMQKPHIHSEGRELMWFTSFKSVGFFYRLIKFPSLCLTLLLLQPKEEKPMKVETQWSMQGQKQKAGGPG